MGAPRLLVDVGVGRYVADWLRREGYDVCAVRDLDPRMKDPDIVRLAVRERRLILTMDKDFGELVFHSGLDHHGVLLLRLDDATGPEKAQVIARIMQEHGEILEGNFCVFQGGRLRIRAGRR